MSEWKPIETAPKNGRLIWLGCGRFMRLGCWINGEEHENFGTIGGGWKDYIAMEGRQTFTGLRFMPTHWMALPSPPDPDASEYSPGDIQ